MDGTSQGQPSPQSGNTPTSNPSTSSEQENKVTGQHDHRDITPTSGENLVARATAAAGKDEQLSRRSVSRKKYTPVEIAEMGYKVKESREAIRTFVRESGLNKNPEHFVLNCTLNEGYSTATQHLFIGMKQVLDEHFSNVNQLYQVLQSDYSVYRKLETTARSAARSRRITEEEQALLKDFISLGNPDKRHEDYWEERARIHLYASLCGIRFNAALKVMPKLNDIRTCETERKRETFCNRIEDFLPQSIECMKTYREVIQYQLGLGQYSELAESLEVLDRAAFGAALLTDQAMLQYLLTDDQDKLRQMLSTHSHCFSQWLADFDPEQRQFVEVGSNRIKHLINAAILTDNPKQAERLLKFYRKQVEANHPDFPPEDAHLLCESLVISLSYLYDRPEPLADFKTRLEGAGALVVELENLIRTINKNKTLGEKFRAALVVIFEHINRCYQSVIKCVHLHEAQVAQIASDLIAEEQQEQQQIQEKLKARAKKRREKEEQRQEAQWQKKQATQAAAEAEAAEKQPVPSEPKPYDLESTLNEAARAFAQKESIGVLNNIFKKVINHPQVTGFDKAQAHYSYADMVTSRLRRQLECVHTMIEPVYAYSEALENQGLPELEKDIKFREALKQFKLNMQQISIYTLIMDKAVKEAQEIFFSLDEDQPEFVDALVDLHNDMEYLVAQGKAVIQCCRDIPDIYVRRGKMIQHHQLSKKSDSEQHSESSTHSERHRELAHRIRDLEELGRKLDTSMGMLEKTLTCEQATQVRQTLTTAKANTPASEEKTSPPSIEDKQQPLKADAPDPAPELGTDSAQDSQPDPETPLVAETAADIQEPQEAAAPPLRLPIPENMMIALGTSIMECKLMAPMKLNDSERVQEKSLTTAKSRKGKKGKQQGRKGKGPVTPQPQASAVKKEKVDPGELGLKLQTRLSDYLEVLNDTGKTPDGKAVPEGLNLKAMLARIQQGTFLKDSRYFAFDFTFLSDALKMPIQINLPMSNRLFFRPGLVKPEQVNLLTHPESHLHLELPAYGKENQWFASMEHYFQSGLEEDCRLFAKEPVKETKTKNADGKSKKGS